MDKNIDFEKRVSYAVEIGAEALDWYEQFCGQDCSSTNSVACHNPSTGEHLWNIPESSPDLIEVYVQKAKLAQPKWAALPATERARILTACADKLENKKEDLAQVLALETGKALVTECRVEVGLLVSIFRYFAGLVHEIKGRSIQAAPKLMGFTTYHPWGVVAGIVPWNVPLMFMAYKVAAPIAAGNSVIIKMPEQATATLAMALREILPLLPEGVVQFISGSGLGAGNALVTHSKIDKISFTGSVATGSTIYQNAASQMKPVTLELGGKSPMVILADCDMEKAVNGIVGSMRFTRSGQSCTAASRIYVPREQIGEYEGRLSETLNAMRVGHALDESTECGPVVTLTQKNRIEGYLKSARDDHLDVRSYSKLTCEGIYDEGYYIVPHLIIDPDHAHPVSQEEIFGPVATITGYDDLEAAMELSNDTAFGLSASIWGKDIDQCLDCAARFRAGIVQINQNAIMLPGFSYGGVGMSGIGKESSLEAMLETYMYEKTNIVNFGR